MESFIERMLKLCKNAHSTSLTFQFSRDFWFLIRENIWLQPQIIKQFFLTSAKDG